MSSTFEHLPPSSDPSPSYHLIPDLPDPLISLVSIHSTRLNLFQDRKADGSLVPSRASLLPFPSVLLPSFRRRSSSSSPLLPQLPPLQGRIPRGHGRTSRPHPRPTQRSHRGQGLGRRVLEMASRSFEISRHEVPDEEGETSCSAQAVLRARW